MRLRLLALTCLLTFAAACSGDDDRPPTPTLFPELEASPGPTVIPPPIPTQPPPLTEAPGTIWLIDVAVGNVVTIHEDAQHPAPIAWLDEATDTFVYQPAINGRSTSIRVALDGTEIERGDHIRTPGPARPQTRWQLDRVPAGEIESGGATYHLSDMWVEDTQTGQRTLLVSGLWQCTNCDAISVADWSPSGRYVFYGENGGANRVFVSNLQTATTRDITVDRLDGAPQWSPVADLLIRPTDEGQTILEDLAAGTETTLSDVPWPAAFDPSGRYLYSLASGPDTVIADVASGEVIATLRGSALYDALNEAMRPLPGRTYPGPLWEVPHPVVGTDGGFLAALSRAPNCQGTQLFTGGDPLGCIEDAGNPVFSPDGSQVILARRTGETGPVDSPTIQAVSLNIYEIVLVDTETGAKRILATDALGSRFTPGPQVIWNASGTHVLVRWPFQGYGP